jgi:Fe-S-cluster containining protein
MRELLKDRVGGEPQATCDDCAMCPSHGSTPGVSELYFNPESKCCTYIPELPNYLVGRILSDSDPALAHGRNTVRARLQAGAGVTPLGIDQPVTFEVLYRAAPGLFGRSQTLRCPHYIEEGGRCGVWRHRPSVCATWHCKHERGMVGKVFWKALHQLLCGVQRALARWCVTELPPPVLSVLFPAHQGPGSGRPIDAADIDGIANPAVYDRAWGALKGREEEFYRGCARRVDALTWKDVRRIGGSELEILERLLLSAWKDLLSKALPDRLRPGSIRVTPVSPETSRVLSYSELDPLEVPSELLEVLGYFDGRSTDEALAAIARERGLSIERDLLRQLVDFQVLVPGA